MNLSTRRWLAPSACLVIVMSSVVALALEGRRWWCACGHPWLWISDVWSEHCSQHLFDPYSITHVSHGLFFFCAFAWLRIKWPPVWQLAAVLAIAGLWEVVENSAFVIDRYRHETMSLNYMGDSIANSVGDMLCAGAGFLLARRLGMRYTLAIFVISELILLALIRDNLTLNVIMLIHPVEAIKAWQTLGHA